MYIDSHCHIDFECFDSDRTKLLSDCYQQHIKHLILPATTRHAWDNIISLCKASQIDTKSPKLWPALGLHPYFLAQHSIAHCELLDDYCQQELPLAIGEIGLDFYLNELDKKTQIEYFTRQLDIAIKHQLPIIVHARKSHDDILSILRKKQCRGGVIHAFNGSHQQAHQYNQLNFKLGFGGAFTYERAKKLQGLVRELPLEYMVLETDAPDMAPSFAKGETNTPLNIGKIFQHFCQLRHENSLDIEKQLFHNVSQLFPKLSNT